MQFLFFLFGILLLGAACTSPAVIPETPVSQTELPQPTPSYDLFAEDAILFVDAEEIIPTTITVPTGTILITEPSALVSLKIEQKKKIASNSHSTIISPKKDSPPLPPKTVITKKVEEMDEEVEKEYEEVSDETCEPEWDCSEWSSCTSAGVKTYSCVDTNGCEEDYSDSESCKPPSKLTRGPYTVAITGSNTTCRNNTVKAINLLKTLPASYEFFITYVGEVNCIPQASRMDVYQDPPRFEVGYVTAGGGDIWYASVLVHEACHSQQYRDYVYKYNSFDVPLHLFYGYNAEYACNQTQKKVLIALGAEQYMIDSMDDMSFEWWSLSEEDQAW